MTLERGSKYELGTLHFVGWTAGDGTGAEGYHTEDYFAADGSYLGADAHGIEPVFKQQLPERVLARWDKEDWDDDRMVATHYRYYDQESGDEIELTEEESSRYTWGPTEDNITGGSQAGKISE